MKGLSLSSKNGPFSFEFIGTSHTMESSVSLPSGTFAQTD